MNINFEIVEKIDNNSDLRSATENIVAGVNASVQGYYIIGKNLDEINVKKLWAQAGFSSFAEYSEKVLGISKATAYRIISVSKKFIEPEFCKPNTEKIFSPFQDTALAALNPVGDYNTTAEFIAENNITPETPVSEIRKIVAEFQDEKKATKEKEVDAETESESNEETENGNENKKELLEKALETFINAAWDIFGDLNKPKSKRKKTPIKTIEKTCKEISTLLDLD